MVYATSVYNRQTRASACVREPAFVAVRSLTANITHVATCGDPSLRHYCCCILHRSDLDTRPHHTSFVARSGFGAEPCRPGQGTARCRQ